MCVLLRRLNILTDECSYERHGMFTSLFSIGSQETRLSSYIGPVERFVVQSSLIEVEVDCFQLVYTFALYCGACYGRREMSDLALVNRHTAVDFMV